MQQSLKSTVPCRKNTRVLNHVAHPMEACRVKVAWGVLRVRRSSHPQHHAGQVTFLGRELQGEQGRATRQGVSLLPWKLDGDTHHLGKLGTRSELSPPGNSRSLLFGVCLVWAGSSYKN